MRKMLFWGDIITLIKKNLGKKVAFWASFLKEFIRNCINPLSCPFSVSI